MMKKHVKNFVNFYYVAINPRIVHKFSNDPYYVEETLIDNVDTLSSYVSALVYSDLWKHCTRGRKFFASFVISHYKWYHLSNNERDKIFAVVDQQWLGNWTKNQDYYVFFMNGTCPDQFLDHFSEEQVNEFSFGKFKCLLEIFFHSINTKHVYHLLSQTTLENTKLHLTSSVMKRCWDAIQSWKSFFLYNDLVYTYRSVQTRRIEILFTHDLISKCIKTLINLGDLTSIVHNYAFVSFQ